MDAASLEVESPSVAIDDAYLTWNAMDSVGREFTPTENDPKQPIVNDACDRVSKMSSQIRNYYPPCRGN